MLDSFFRMHRRTSASNLRWYRGSKLARPPDTHPEPVCLLSVCPPFLAELCHRKHGQLVLAVSFNLCILNDQGLQTPPPTMPYAVGMDAVFKSRALYHLKKLKLRRSPMSPAFMGLVSSWDYKDCPISDGE